MPHPCLLFCPYLPLSLDEPVVFADWELGTLESFKDRWADPRFEDQATALLSKFVVGPSNERVRNPALLCKKDKKLDGQKPALYELRALELSLVFALVDKNPRKRLEDNHGAWAIVTADNAELYAWPIDLEQGRITLSAGELVTVNVAGYKISDPELVLRPPLDLHMPILAPSPDPLVLTGIYETVLRSLRSPGENSIAHQVRVAVEWFAKAWPNTQAVQWPERLVYLKTAFEALTGTSTNWKSAHKLRETFEALPHTKGRDSEILVWSPEEKPVHPRTWVDKNGHPQLTLITDLEHWFRAFGDARNTIIHEGGTPQLTYAGSNPAYSGPFFFTAEFLLRGVIKVLLSELGYENAWRSELWRTIDAAAHRKLVGEHQHTTLGSDDERTIRAGVYRKDIADRLGVYSKTVSRALKRGDSGLESRSRLHFPKKQERSMLKLDWGDAQVWMNIAEELYLRNAKAPEDFLRTASGFPHTNEMNVAAVCAGYAFELIYKVLVRIAGGKPDAKHSPRSAHKKLKELNDREVGAEVDRIIAHHGWDEHDHLLEYLDDLCHGDRKYWMRPKDGGKRGVTTMSVGGRKGCDALKRLHEDLSRFAMKRIESNSDIHERWPGTA